MMAPFGNEYARVDVGGARAVSRPSSVPPLRDGSGVRITRWAWPYVACYQRGRYTPMKEPRYMWVLPSGHVLQGLKSEHLSWKIAKSYTSYQAGREWGRQATAVRLNGVCCPRAKGSKASRFLEARQEERARGREGTGAKTVRPRRMERSK